MLSKNGGDVTKQTTHSQSRDVITQNGTDSLALNPICLTPQISARIVRADAPLISIALSLSLALALRADNSWSSSVRLISEPSFPIIGSESRDFASSFDAIPVRDRSSFYPSATSPLRFTEFSTILRRAI